MVLLEHEIVLTMRMPVLDLLMEMAAATLSRGWLGCCQETSGRFSLQLTIYHLKLPQQSFGTYNTLLEAGLVCAQILGYLELWDNR